MTKDQKEKSVVHITYKLTGELAELFLRIKSMRFLENNTELARSLMLERLHEIDRQSASDRKKSDTRGARELAA